VSTALQILGITSPIYLAIALGYVVTRFGVFGRADMRLFGRFTLNIALPALLFHTFSSRNFEDIFNPNYIGAYALSTLIMVAISMVWARRVLNQQRTASSIFAMGTSCPNSGFVGYPLMLITLGPETAGIALALNMLVENLLIIPLLLAFAESGATQARWQAILRHTVRGLLRNPMIWSIAAGFGFAVSGWSLPEPVGRTVQIFSSASAALSLFVIGGSLVGLRLSGLRQMIASIALGKLVIHPIIMALTLTYLFTIESSALNEAAMLVCAMPMMGIYTALAQRYGHEDMGAAASLVTTVLSFFTISALLWAIRI
jgi:malonate transporter